MLFVRSFKLLFNPNEPSEMFAHTLAWIGWVQGSGRRWRNQILFCSAEAEYGEDVPEWFSDCVLVWRLSQTQPRLPAQAQKLSDI